MKTGHDLYPCTIEPHQGQPARCQAWFHGAEGQCTRPAAWDVISSQGEVAELCEECAAPYRAKAAKAAKAADSSPAQGQLL